jgi:hypothetical protein
MRRRHTSGHKRGGSRRALTNETKYPFIVELAVTGEELELALSRRIIDFHNRRHIRTRHGRTINGEKHYRWCFSDIATARAFAEQFGGAFYKP